MKTMEENKKCSSCNCLIVNNNMNITFCPSCGKVILLTNKNLNLDLNSLNDKVNEEINLKHYDMALLYLFNIEYYNKDIAVYKQMINCFKLAKEDDKEVLNLYVFNNENLFNIYNKAFKVSEDKELLSSYNEFKKDYLLDLNNTINTIKENNLKRKEELDALKGYKDNKPKYYNTILLVSIILIIIGMILGFAIDNKTANIIGYILDIISVFAIIIMAYISPTINVTDRTNKLNALIAKSEEEIKEINKVINELK